MRSFKTAALIICICSFAFACGSGGGDKSTSPTQEQVIGLKTNILRTVSPGDNWEYSVTATWSDGTATDNLSGSSTVSILFDTQRSPVSGIDCLDKYKVIDMTGSRGKFVRSSHTYFFQDANGTHYNCGWGTEVKWVTSPPKGYFLSAESPLAVGQSYSTSVAYDNGDSGTYSYSVESIEYVSIEMGTYESYRIETNYTHSYTNGHRTEGNDTIWYVPGLGAIKKISNFSHYTGEKTHVWQFVYILTGTSVTY
ncbi:MAG: hypothetical protein GXP46_07350 [Deferribacteres bacterium]|nr:hypothetical protein [Deferribacteres bacterium]